ncbi:hypothetical protein JOF41_000758 [Saccharothrix coeruleofusca]|uniref:PE domain-containing protein n=1 Tax=Saccharothrix coeruleofusca TaxID=33919 RepID=UPI001AE93B3B|nr:PE domain-containing protein [Saccharothrix coeruleofusca]MBP2334580.1 hypothetical protein [Saccharothrix coeruleofusca]
MPFLASGDAGGTAGTTGGVTMQVEPGRILALKARYEAVRDMVQDFYWAQRENLKISSFGDDEVSKDASKVFRKNADTAIDVITRFIDELNLNIEQLDQAAKTYNLVEDTNHNTMQQQNRGI